MRAGDLRRRVSIQQRSATLDSWGQQVLSWADVLTNVPAAFDELTGAERLHAAQRMGAVSHKVTIRYHSTLTDPKVMDSYRIVYGARLFDINYVMNINERNRTIELYCTEGLNDGQ